MADPDAPLDEVCAFLEAKLGLHFPHSRRPDLERGLAATAADLGWLDAAETARHFAAGEATPAQVDILAGHLTIGETYFFRDPAVFALLAGEVIPDLIHARRSGNRCLHLWSAACCTGEEAYSLAMVVRRLLPDLSDWKVTILGTDVNPKFLHKAVAGIYGDWSFRNVDEATRSEYFDEVGEGRFAAKQGLRDMVSFLPLNLAEDNYPSLANQTCGIDILFCRNVLMYFSREQARRTVTKLGQALASGGWLFTSGAEASRELFADLAPVFQAGTLSFRKDDQVFGRQLPPVERVTAPPAATPAPRQPVAPLPSLRIPAAATPADRMTLARRLGNEGHFTAALEACEQGIDGDKLVAAHHYLRGVILQELGLFDAAAAALRRALYLDQKLIVAHFALGNLLRRQDRTREAQRSFENATALLREQPPDVEIPEADGLTVGRLLAILESIK